MKSINGFFDYLAQRLELSRGGINHNLRPMEGLRGVAVLMVFAVHYVSGVQSLNLHHSPMFAALMKTAHHIGNTGVDLFFVLSGYLIYGMLIRRPTPYGPFIWRRAVRLYPTFLAVFAVYVVLSLLLPSKSKIPLPLWSEGALYLLQNLLFLPGLFPIEPLITVAWSLSYEWFFYLTVPLVLRALNLPSREVEFRLRTLTLCTAGGALAFAFYGGPVRMLMFMAGMFAFDLLRSPFASRFSSRLAWSAALLAVVLMALPMPGAKLQAVKFLALGGALAVACVHMFATPGALMGRLLSVTPLRWLGNISYSYYLIHGLTINAAFMAVGYMAPAMPGDLIGLVLAAPVLVATLCTGLALFLWIERPLSLSAKS